MEIRTKIKSRIENYESKGLEFSKEINELKWILMIMDNQD